jgi:NitT/TauT family transport system ATP-binding protein
MMNVVSRAVATDLPRKARPLLVINGVEKVYSNGMQALAGIDLTLPGESQFLSLLGPSGCGKSTLLRMMADLDKPTAGTIDWPTTNYDAFGRPLADLGFVFQDPTLMPWATVFENMYLPFRATGKSRKSVRDEIMAALAMVRLERFSDHYPRQLSGGMKMRVSVARALVRKPRLLLMDEPFAALDEITRLKLNNDLLEMFQAYKLTVVFVTHSVYESVYLSNRIVVMAARPGRVVGDIAIDVPYPRGESYRSSRTYVDYCRTISSLLAETMYEFDGEQH